MIHVNVYGPVNSGKTRHAERLKEKYDCGKVVDEGVQRLRMPGNDAPKLLILTRQPFVAPNVRNISIYEALK